MGHALTHKADVVLFTRKRAIAVVLWIVGKGYPTDCPRQGAAGVLVKMLPAYAQGRWGGVCLTRSRGLG